VVDFPVISIDSQSEFLVHLFLTSLLVHISRKCFATTRDCCQHVFSALCWRRNRPICQTHSSSERVCYFTERVLNVRSDQKIKNASSTRSFRCFRRTTMFNFWTGDFCIHFGCVSIKCKIKRLIFKRTVYKLIKRLIACTFVSRSET